MPSQEHGYINVLRLGLSLISVVSFSACGEASVGYRGTVTEGTATGHSFDENANPTDAVPIEGAFLEFYFESVPDSCHEAKVEAVRVTHTDSDGSFRLKPVVFGGFAGTEHLIVICVSAEGYRVYRYQSTFENSDPTDESQFLNIKLQSR